ncbi:unnamed protein product [Rotaria sordida]|uniref:Uncharacterized protein n=2 Tax=Rotaria sordida TaxID=392033 RepID=A0A814WDF0_9BILA|nr:unnamed protein product [Rotaria sordida]
MVDDAISSSGPVEREILNDAVSSMEQRINTKRSNTASWHSPKSKWLPTTTTHDYSVKNIEEIPSHFICPYCKLVFREPYQLVCGHQACQSCINFTNNEMICLICSEVSSKENIRLDHDFSRKVQQKLISCSICDWIGSLTIYQQHIDQQHHNIESKAMMIDVHTQQYDHSNLIQHVNKSETQQEILSNVFSSSCSMLLPHNSSTINNQQQSHNIIRHNHRLLETIDVVLSPDLKISYDLLAQELWPMKQASDNALRTSDCGTYRWKISDVQKKIGIINIASDAQSGRQKSIYSPAFYLSPTGYKMCLRLYLNGDSDVRGRHISLFLVIMRGEYDAFIDWPFSYEVLFRLIDQSTLNNNQRNIIASFWPDTSSDSFQRPFYSMNHGYDNTMLIETKINTLNERPVSSSILYIGGSPNDEEYIDTTDEDFTNIN